VLALGLSVDFPKAMRPVVRAVLLSDPLGVTQTPTLADITVVDEFELTSPEEDWAKLARDYGQAASGRISSLRPEAVVIRRADRPQRPNNYDGPRLRLVIDGALAAAAYQHVANTHLLTGSACASAYDRADKDALDRDAKGLVSKVARAEASGAALSALVAHRV
jgi:hypothetical protein